MEQKSEETTKTRPQPIEVQVKPHTYQPSKAELEADITVDAKPEQMRAVLTRSVVIKTEE